MKSKQIILNSKEKKNIQNWLKDYYGIKELKIDKAFLKSSKDKIYLISNDIGNLETKDIRINIIGMYFAKEEKNGFRLSIEGSQIVGPKASKNVAELSKEQIDSWIKGNDVDFEGKFDSFVLIKHEDDFYGVGLFKAGKILNYVPKERRIKKM